MKRNAPLLLIVALAAAVTLGALFARGGLKVEDCTWTLATVQDQDGNVIACGPEDTLHYPNAQELSLLCSAENGSLTVTRPEGNISGTYQQTQRSGKERIYQVHVQDLGQGYAVCAYTQYDSGKQLPTLVVAFPQKYTFTFTGNRK
ncbi:MAG: hypothetical protein ACOYJZ_06000 [Acutalibacter sp.]